MLDHLDALCQGGRAGRAGPGRNKSVLVPLADLPQAHSQEVGGGLETSPPSAGQGRLLVPPSHPTPGLALRGREGSRTSKAGGCAQEAAAGAVLEPQSGGREGAAGTCIVRAPLPAGPPGAPPARVPGVCCWGRPAGSQAGSNWAEGTRAARSFIYIRIHPLLSRGRSWRAKTVRDPKNPPRSWLCGQTAGLESWLLHSLAV